VDKGNLRETGEPWTVHYRSPNTKNLRIFSITWGWQHTVPKVSSKKLVEPLKPSGRFPFQITKYKKSIFRARSVHTKKMGMTA
jgi:hypothetical protein